MALLEASFSQTLGLAHDSIARHDQVDQSQRFGFLRCDLIAGQYPDGFALAHGAASAAFRPSQG